MITLKSIKLQFNIHTLKSCSVSYNNEVLTLPEIIINKVFVKSTKLLDYRKLIRPNYGLYPGQEVGHSDVGAGH